MGKHDLHRGLSFHLRALRSGALKRREVVRWAIGAGLVTLVGCGDDDTDAANEGGSGTGGNGGSAAAGSGGRGGGAASGHSGSSGAGGAGGSAASSCSEIPEETGGPYPADGSNGLGGGPGGGGGPGSGSSAAINALVMSGIVRGDIRSSFGISTTEAAGVPLQIKLRIVDVANGCSPLDKRAVYIWHCDRSGNYSLYSDAITSENYLRGVQETDEDGYVTFTSIYPACYSGRWPHIHFEVYPSLDDADNVDSALRTSQIAMPQDACNEVFAASGYETSVTNFKQVSLSTDNVFSDGYSTQVPTISGSVSDGFVIELTAGVKVS